MVAHLLPEDEPPSFYLPVLARGVLLPAWSISTTTTAEEASGMERDHCQRTAQPMALNRAGTYGASSASSTSTGPSHRRRHRDSCPTLFHWYIPLRALVLSPILELWQAGLFHALLLSQALDGKVLQIMHQ